MTDDVNSRGALQAQWYQKRMTVPKGRGQTYLVWACSKCGGHEKKRSRFCPNCGRRMIEVSENE